MKKSRHNHIVCREVEMPAKSILLILAFVLLLSVVPYAVCGAGSQYDGTPAVDSAAKYLLQTDRQISSMHCEKEPLQLALLSLSRQSGVSLMLDPQLQQREVSGTFDGLHVSQILQRIERSQHLQFEQIGEHSLYVSASEEPVVTASAEPTLQPEPVSPGVSTNRAAPLSIDDVLKMPVTANANLPICGPPAAVFPQGKSVTLQTGIEHNERLAPVDRSLKVGTEISVTRLKSLTPANHWSRLPNWAAGTWKTTSMTAYYRYDYQSRTKNFLVDTFMDKAAETLGWQKDRLGNLWHFVGTGFYTTAEGERSFDIDFHKQHDILEVNDDQFTVRHVGTRALVDKITRKVVRVFQVEAIQTYTKSTEGSALRCKSSVKEFDDAGEAVTLQKGISYEAKIHDYSPWNSYKGRDMRKLFAEFLMSHGMNDLVP